jgi:hypothetical protein
MEKSLYLIIEHMVYKNVMGIAYTKEDATILLNVFHQRMCKPWAYIEEYTLLPPGVLVWKGYYKPTLFSSSNEVHMPLYRTSSEQSFDKSLEDHYF